MCYPLTFLHCRGLTLYFWMRSFMRTRWPYRQARWNAVQPPSDCTYDRNHIRMYSTQRNMYTPYTQWVTTSYTCMTVSTYVARGSDSDLRTPASHNVVCAGVWKSDSQWYSCLSPWGHSHTSAPGGERAQSSHTWQHTGGS